MSKLELKVVAGHERQYVGRIVARAGMLTSNGYVERVTAKTVYFSDGSGRRNLSGISVRHSEAMKFGYPFSSGCVRLVRRNIRRDGQALVA